jgi:hypothetical protein
MRCLKIFGRKEWMLEDILKFIFSGRKFYDRALRKLLQFELIEKWENDVAVKSIWRMIVDPVELSNYI